MKKSFFILILCVFTISANQVDALSYKGTLNIKKTENPNISQNHISEAKLLHTYVLRYKENIANLYALYSSEESQIIKDAYTILDTMGASLINIQDAYYQDNDASEIMQSIVVDLKLLNTRVKVYLEQQKVIHEKKVKKILSQHISIGQRISKILDTLIDQLSRSLIRKESLSENEKRIVQSLVKIRSENQKIKDLKNMSFSSEEEIKVYFKEIIKTIRQEILRIKDLSRSS
jgi:hypothetical protein